MSMPHQLDNTLRNGLNCNLLRYACGQHISCPVCGDILDAPNSVLLHEPSVPLCVPCLEEIIDKHLWRLHPDPFGLHELESEQDMRDVATARVVDIDGRALNWE